MTERIARLSVASIALSVILAQTQEPTPRLTPDQLATQIRGRDLSLDPLHVQESAFELLSQPSPGGGIFRYVAWPSVPRRRRALRG